MNRLSVLPRGFGSFKSLEILDLTYNNLNERSLPGNFFFIDTLRALYLGDNDFEMLPGDVMNLRNLQILVMRDNDLLTIPREIGHLTNLKELHIQGNRLTVLPPEVGALDLIGSKQVLRLEHNPWVPSIQEQFDARGAQGVMDFIRSDQYKYFYGRQEVITGPVPPKRNKDRKLSRKQHQSQCA
ncbi:Ras suppressor protein 1 [Trichostrongylus colubriformis]|uniref:Ras suppressor protein 1 n=1 Tax=Trichostrongylus colubriformis TaxID=6319 RepID=A0AAN8F9H0_TRICO